MKNALVGVCIAVSVLSCSEPDCAPSEIKVGMSCRSLRRDSGAAEDDQTAETRSDAATASDAGASVDTGKPGASSEHDAGSDASGSSPIPNDADGAIMTVPMPVCGDGIVNGIELCDPKIATGQRGACLTATDCKNDKCGLATLTGTPDTCNVRCEASTQEKCTNGDQCCPAGCNQDNDNDCSASCGDGLVDANETCEPKVGAGCVVSCTPANSCEKATLIGDASNCNVACIRTKIVSPDLHDPSDHCCPDGANTLTDKDCAPTCMNGIKEGAETCDGADCPTVCNDIDPCTGSLAPTGTSASCNVACPVSGYPIIKPKSDDKLCCSGAGPLSDNDCPGCGNGKIEAGETCDKNCSDSCDDGNECTVDSQSGNSATCNLACSHVTKGADHTTKDNCCPPGANAASDVDCAGCGNRVKEGSEQCDDGNTANGDLCDQNCMVEDNPNTPGDDRPGYVICETPMSCSTSTGCGLTQPVDPVTNKVTNKFVCGADLNGPLITWVCDGPEDCAAGQACRYAELVSGHFTCGPATTFALACHNSSDCGARGPCENSSGQLGLCQSVASP